MSQLHLLGVPRFDTGEESLVCELEKPASLLFYLAYRSDWVSRSELAFLYRPDVTETTALNYLRKLIFRAKAYPWAQGLVIEKTRLYFAPATDVSQFQEAYQSGLWQETISSYTGDFLSGFNLDDTPSYQTWLELERQVLNQQWQDALRVAATTAHEQQQDARAVTYWQQLLDYDNLNEEALQGLIMSYANLNKAELAVDHYQRFEEELNSLDMKPLASTQDLIATLRASPNPQLETVVGLPQRQTRFIGRTQELAEAQAKLSDPHCRLLTVVGLGGVGKTRFVLELAERQAKRYKTVCFLPLADNQEGLLTILATHLRLSIAAEADLASQVLDAIADQSLLLVLDNAEDITDVTVISQLLTKAPQLTCLASSRHALNLQGEWLLELRGLSLTSNIDQAEAVELFLDGIHRHQHGFRPSQEELALIGAFCHEVEGYPLAIELAASWARLLSIEAIYNEFRTNFNQLSGHATDLPERHQSIAAVIQSSWQHLSQAARQSLMALALCQQSFSLEATKAFGIPLGILFELQRRSLLSRLSGQRFRLHALVQRYALQQLEPPDAERLRDQQVHFFLNLLSQQSSAAHFHPEQLQEDWLNIRSSWLYSLSKGRYDQLLQLQAAFFQYYTLSGQSQEGAELCRRCLELMSTTEAREHLLYGHVHLQLGDFFRRLGQREASRQHYQNAFDVGARSGDEVLCGMALRGQGILDYEQGRWDDAAALLEQALARLPQGNDLSARATCLNLMGLISSQRGQFEQASSYFEQGIALYQKLDDPLREAELHNNLANIAERQGQYKNAIAAYQNCLAIFEAQGFQRGIAVIQTNLGLAHARLGELAKATELTQASIALKKTMHNARGILLSSINLAIILHLQHRTHEALELLIKAAIEAFEQHYLPLCFEALIEYAHCDQHDDISQSIFRVTLSHPAATEEHKSKARALLSNKGQLWTLEELIEHLQKRHPDSTSISL